MSRIRGTFLGVPISRTIDFGDLCWVAPILLNPTPFAGRTCESRLSPALERFDPQSARTTDCMVGMALNDSRGLYMGLFSWGVL